MGKSNSRLIRIVCFPLSEWTCVLEFLFRSIVFHNQFQFVEPVVPHLPEWFDKICDLFHFVWVEVVVNFSAGAFFREQITLGEYLNVPGHRWSGGIKIGRDGSCRQGLGSQQNEYAPPGGVCDGLKGVSSYLHCVAVWLQIYM